MDETSEVLEITSDDLKKQKPALEITRKDVGMPRDIGDEIEIKLGQAREELEDEIEIAPMETIAPKHGTNPAEQDKLNREQFLNNQKQEFEKRYAHQQIHTPIEMPTHFQQERKGEDGTYSCVAASCRNALYALNVADISTDDEDSIINAMGGRSAFDNAGYISSSKAIEFLRTRGLRAEETPALTDIVESLRKGGVAIMSYGSHAMLISGMETTGDGKVLFRVNNPFRENMKKIDAQKMIDEILATNNRYGIVTINISEKTN